MHDHSLGGTVVLITDFGLEDNYVGVLKGVIRSIAPETAILDLTHGVPPQDVRAAAFLLERSVDFFPPGSIFLAIVDPGVGTDRGKLALSSRGNSFVGPDNGLFTSFLEGAEIHRIDNPEFQLPTVSNTFHGRDVFAPAAAHLARGLPLEALGPRSAEAVRLERTLPRNIAEGWVGEIVYVDRYGNLVTNFEEKEFGEILASGSVRVETEPALHWPYVTAYAAVTHRGRCSVFGGFGALELSLNQGNAAESSHLGPRAKVVLRKC